MATVTHSLLEQGQELADQSSYVTDIINPEADRLLLVAVAARASASINTPTLSGNGLTWVLVDGGEYDGVEFRGVWVFRSMGPSPTSGAITIDFGGQTQLHALWVVSTFNNMDTSGSNGAGAIVQVVNNFPATSETSLTVTLAAFGSNENATYGALSHEGNGLDDINAGGGFSEIAEEQASSSTILQSQWRDDPDTGVDWSWTNSSLPGGIAVEIKASVDFIPQLTPRPNPLIRM
jgi:hypothetical protein